MQIKDISSFPGFKNIEKQRNKFIPVWSNNFRAMFERKRITYILMIELLLIMNYAFNILFFFKIF